MNRTRKVTSIESGAFIGCSSLKELTMPCSASIAEHSFSNCTNIEKVTLTKGTGIMTDYSYYNNDYNPWTISGNNCKNIVLENGIANIGSYAFCDCYSLKSITIPDSVTSINNNAFGSCQSLENVYFTGSKDEWENINISSDNYDNYYLLNANINYNYTLTPNTEQCDVHKWNSGNTVEPTCGNGGYTIYQCTVCGATKKNNITDSTGLHKYDNGVITTKPTCTKAGVKTFTCSVCGDTYTEPVSATGHSYDNGAITTQPTCGAKGVKTFTCSTCGNTYTEDVPATGKHTYDNGVVTTQPTCTKTGVKTFTCTGCDDSYTETVDALGHDYSVTSITTQPTCTKTGKGTYKCSRCSSSYNGSIPALGHDYVKTETIDPTYEAEGYSVYECSRCDDWYEDDFVEQLTLPFNTGVSSYDTDTYKIVIDKSGYLIFDFVGESNNCTISIFDEDNRLVDTMKPVFKEFFKKSYLQQSEGSAVVNENQIIALLSGTYYIEVNCPSGSNYSGYYEMSIDYSASKETITENKYDF